MNALPEVMETPGVVFVIDGNHEIDAIVKALGGEVPAKEEPGEGQGSAEA